VKGQGISVVRQHQTVGVNFRRVSSTVVRLQRRRDEEGNNEEAENINQGTAQVLSGRLNNVVNLLAAS